MFTIKKKRLSQLIKRRTIVVRCPYCNHRQFDGLFVGIVEIICPRCSNALTIICSTEPPQMAECLSERNGHSPEIEPVLTEMLTEQIL